MILASFQLSPSLREPELPSKPSKSAIKKAQKLAREERRLREKAAAKQAKRLSGQDQSELDTPAPSDVTSLPPSLPKPGTTESGEPAMTTTADESLWTQQNGKAYDPPPPPAHRETHDKKPVQPSQQPAKVGDLSSQNPPKRRDPMLKSAEPAKPRITETSGPTPSSKEIEKSKKFQSFLTRTLWTFIMIGGFIGMFTIHFPPYHGLRSIRQGCYFWDTHT